MQDQHESLNNLFRILLVDDSENDVIIIQDAFRQAKLLNQITVVRDGEAALKYLRKESPFESALTPGLILLDINMPKKNGFEVLETMKADPLLKVIPVIMLTTSDREEDIVKSYSDGACSFVTKPVDMKKLVEVVRGFGVYWALVSKIPRDRSDKGALA